MKKNIVKVAFLLFAVVTFLFSGCTAKDNSNNTTSATTSTTQSSNENTNANSIPQDESSDISKEAENVISGRLLVTDNSVNIRSEASTKSDIITTVSKGEILVFKEQLKNDWYKIEYGKDTAFISAKYVKVLKDDEYKDFETKIAYDELYGTILENANLRTLPDTTIGEIIMNLSSKNTFKIDSLTRNHWYKVTLGDTTSGYVYADLVTTISKSEYELITKKPEKIKKTQKNDLTKISSYYSDYSFSNENRKFNLERACDSMNTMVIEPGAKFDWCRDMGPCGKDEGYLLSNVIIDGEYVQDYGGGICQVSSTLSAAISTCEDGNFSILERYKHGIPQSYVPSEYDATVSYPDCNFSFRNDNLFPIMIECICSDDMIITINIYKIEE